MKTKGKIENAFQSQTDRINEEYANGEPVSAEAAKQKALKAANTEKNLKLEVRRLDKDNHCHHHRHYHTIAIPIAISHHGHRHIL